MPLEMICGTISREFHGFASKNYITECLDSKYRDMTQSHPTPRTQPNIRGNVTLPNDDNKIIEQSSTINQPNIPTDIKDTEIEEIEKEILPETVDLGSLPSNEQQQQPIEEEQTQELEIIRPEDYTIQDLPKYSTQLKDRILYILIK